MIGGEAEIELAKISFKLGLELFLNVNNIILTSEYILHNYQNDPNGTSFEWFQDLILNIIKNPVNIELYGYIGMPTLRNHNEKFVFYIRFLGDTLCTIPLEYYLNNNVPHIHEAIMVLINPTKGLFIEQYTGLEGGITLKGFQNNVILNDLLYKSVYIITLFRRYIETIYEAFDGNEESINFIKKCVDILNKAMELYKGSMKSELYNDIYELCCIIKESVSCKQIYEKIEILWTIIASKAYTVYINYTNNLSSYFKRLDNKSNFS